MSVVPSGSCTDMLYGHGFTQLVAESTEMGVLCFCRVYVDALYRSRMCLTTAAWLLG